MMPLSERYFFSRNKNKEEAAEKKEEAEAKTKKEKDPETGKTKPEAKNKKEPEGTKKEEKKVDSSTDSDDVDALSKEDAAKIKALFGEQEKEIEALNKEILELNAAQKRSSDEYKLIRIEYTKQVRENEETVKRYRKMITDEKVFAITKFAKDLLEVRDAVRFAVENNNAEEMAKETDIEKLRERFTANIEGQQMTAEVMDRVLARFNLE